MTAKQRFSEFPVVSSALLLFFFPPPPGFFFPPRALDVNITLAFLDPSLRRDWTFMRNKCSAETNNYTRTINKSNDFGINACAEGNSDRVCVCV